MKGVNGTCGPSKNDAECDLRAGCRFPRDTMHCGAAWLDGATAYANGVDAQACSQTELACALFVATFSQQTRSFRLDAANKGNVQMQLSSE